MGFWSSLKFWVRDTYESRDEAVPQSSADPAENDYWATGRIGRTPDSTSMKKEDSKDR